MNRTINLAAVAALFLGSSCLASSIQVTYEAAGAQTPDASICSSCYVTFDGLTAGAYSGSYTASFGNGITGTYSNLFLVNADQFGGAGGTGKYSAIGAQSGTLSTTLVLSQAVDYFGIWWSAGDGQNRLSFYSGSTSLGTFSTADAFAAVGSCSGGANQFCGNPNNRSQDSGEPFAYLNFYGQNGTTFDKVVLSNANTGTGFESDNHAALKTVAPTNGTPISVVTATPEPATWWMMAAAAVILFLSQRKRLRANRF